MESKLSLDKTFKHAKFYRVEQDPSVMVVEAISSYIPMEEFKLVFNAITEETIRLQVKKLIFDKRKLTVFHQPSMEWYFVEWKEMMYDLGLRVHRKILPDNPIFKHSVKIGREKISVDHPNGKFKLMDIQYATTIEEAIAN